MTPEQATYGLWGVWLLAWLLAAFWRSKSAAQPASGAQLLYTVITVIGFGLLFSGYSARMLWRTAFSGLLDRVGVPARLWALADPAGWACFVLAAAGFAFAVWARVTLGALWSASVTRKADHHVVDTGPYRLVRHPIYTGLIAGSVALAAVKGTVVALAGLGLVILGFWIKARLEERFLREQLGADAYDAYARRTPMLIPFGPK